MVTLYDCSKDVMEYVRKFIKSVDVEIKEHDNCLYNIRFYGYPVITPVTSDKNGTLLRIGFGQYSLPIRNTEFSRMEIE